MIGLGDAVFLSGRGEVEHQPPSVEQFLMEGLGVRLVIRTWAKLLASPPKGFHVPDRPGRAIAKTTEPLIVIAEQHPVIWDDHGQ